MNSSPVLEPIVRDVRYAFRMLRKTPGFTAIALLTLALGIGANTAVFTVVNALLLRPLPYPQPDRLATVTTLFRSPRGQGESTSVDGKTFLAIHDNARTVDTAVAGGGFGGGVNLVTNGAAANVDQGRVSAGYFSVLGVKPFIGREFTTDEDRTGGQPVAILSHALWTRVFGSDRDIVGRAITLRGEPYTVVGVMPEGFTTGVPTDVWTPLRPSTKGEGGGTNYGMIVRVRPDVSWSEANAEVGRLGSPAAREGRKDDVTALSQLVPLQTGETSEIRQPLLMLWTAVGLVLVIACVNIAGLLLARSSLRGREIATRMALGSGRRAVIRQLLVESAVLAVSGGVLGLLVGWGVLQGLKRLSTDVFPISYPIELDTRVLIATLIVALITSLVFGLVPALHASRVDVQMALAESGTRAVARGTTHWRRMLVVGEVAVGVVLLVGAGLLVRSFVHLRSLNPGFDSTNVITATISLQDARYEDAAKINRLFIDSLARIRRAPGVEFAGVTLGLPYTRLLNMGFGRIEGATAEDHGGMTNVSYITPGYFEALRAPLRIGRLFTESDQAQSMPVAMVNEQFANRFYKGQEIRGLHLQVAGATREVIGVVGNVRATSSGLGGDNGPLPQPAIVYIPAAQANGGFFKIVHVWFSPSWVVRSSGSVEGLPRQIRESLAAVDPLLPIAKMESMADVQSASLASQRFMMSLVLGLGIVALLLAAIGIHGLIASSVSERTRELGIRLALGASGPQVMRTVALPGIALALAGIAIGTVGAFAAVRLLQSFLWGVTSSDPLTFLGVVGTLLAVASVASVVPALRVLRLDPALTLRAE
jgi:predicted permease